MITSLCDFCRLDEPLHLADDLGRRRLDRLHDSLRGRILQFHGLIRLLLDLGGRIQVGFAEILLPCSSARRAFRRQPGSDIFSAFDFLLKFVFVVDVFVAGFRADGFGARILRGAVGAALYIGIDAARGDGNAFRHGGVEKNSCHS